MSDVLITGYAETRIVHRSGRSTCDLASEALHELLNKYELEISDIDGFAATASLSEAPNPFHAAYLAEVLGLELNWLGTGAIGGASMLCAVASAARAISGKQCDIAVVLGADAPSTRYEASFGGYRPLFHDLPGLRKPPAAFALVQRAYEERYSSAEAALCKIALTQRRHALLNPLACEKLKRELSESDYLASPIVADPLRLLDCVMFCDGANGVVLMSKEAARRRGISKAIRVSGYGERTHHGIRNSTRDLLQSGFTPAAATAYQQAGIQVRDVQLLQLYDDFTIAVLIQLEHLGFCPVGEGIRFVLENDLAFNGNLPLNTGGGQLSAGQPGLASGGLSLVEAVRQMFGEAGDRQTSRIANAVVTGIGGIAFGHNWMTSNVMVLEQLK